MEISAKSLGDDKIGSLEVKSSHSIHNVKAKIFDKSITIEVQCLHPSEMTMQIFAKMTKWNLVITLEVESSDTIDDVKEKIQDKMWKFLEVRQLTIMFGGKQLDDWRTLADYNIRNGSTVDVVCKGI